MSDQRFYSPFRKPPPPRQPKPGELLFEFVAPDHVRFRCKLRTFNALSVEAQFYRNEAFLIGRRFYTRALAVQWVEEERKGYERGPSWARPRSQH